MANTKKTIAVEKEKNEKVNDNSIDIEAIIKKAIAETSVKYENEISEYKNEIEQLKKEKEQNIVKFNPNRRVKLMHMGAGSANFSRGRIHVDFKKMFDVVDIRYDIFEDMYDEFRDWFTNFEIVILDKEIREDKGIEFEYESKGADKEIFCEMLKMDNSKMLSKLEKLSYVVAMAFLKFFITEYMNHNQDTVSKFIDVQNFYETRYSIADLSASIQEMLQ